MRPAALASLSPVVFRSVLVLAHSTSSTSHTGSTVWQEYYPKYPHLLQASVGFWQPEELGPTSCVWFKSCVLPCKTRLEKQSPRSILPLAAELGGSSNSPWGLRSQLLPWECSWELSHSIDQTQCRIFPRRWSTCCHLSLLLRKWGRRGRQEQFLS